jgi:stage II sporulation protein M
MIDRTIRPHLLALSALYVAALLAGLLAPQSVHQQAVEAFQRVVEPLRDLPGGQVFILILLNNTIATLGTLLLGVLLGIFPVLSAAANGFLLGVLSRYAAGEGGLGEASLGLLPHGIFEIPAILIAASYGLWLGMAAWGRIRGKEDAELAGRTRHALRMYFKIVFPLLVIAATIETALILGLL